MAINQESRLLSITSPLGPTTLGVNSAVVREEISRPFLIELDLSSKDGELDLDELLGHPVTLRLQTSRNGKRFFHGIVSRCSQGANEGAMARYHAEVVPWLWFLSRTSDCRIFQEKKIPEILEEVFQAHSFHDYELNLTGSYQPKEYCVQYRETDLNFVSRLMEQEGIYYFFRHEENKHTLVIADSISAHNPAEGYEEIPFNELERGALTKECVFRWFIDKEVQPVAFALTDYDFKKPKTSLLTCSSTSRKYGKAEFEVYDFPGEYLETGDGERLADVRLNELQTQYEKLQGHATAKGLAPGHTFELKNHARADQNREYLVTGISIRAESGEYTSDDNETEHFACSFTAIDKAQQYRPARLTPKPIVQGPQTAIVVGPAGEEIHTDEHARVKVQFHWDRYGNMDENSSCWMRVSQPWAGKGWGSLSIPRIGQEVIVDFLEGDPDRPIITGRVYNGEQTPPYGAGKGVVSGLKSKTHKGAGTNEISMDDTAGKENFVMNAQYDHNITVGNNQSNTVGVDQTEQVGSNRSVDIGANDALTVGANRTTDIAANHTVSVGGNQSISVGGNQDVSISGNDKLDIGGASDIAVGGKRSESYGGPQTISNPKMTTTVASKYTLVAGAKINAASPAIDVLAGSKLKAISGGKVDVKAGSKLTQQSGAAMDIKSGAALKAQSSAAMNLKSGAAMKAQAGGAMSLKAGGAISAKGSAIKLNAATKIKGTTLTVN